MVHITCCFQCPSAVVENGKVTCVALWISFFFLNFQGEILHKHILFSCCQWKQKFLFKVSFWLNFGFFVFFCENSPKENGWNSVFSGVVFKHVDQWQPNEFENAKGKRVLEMTARK